MQSSANTRQFHASDHYLKVHILCTVALKAALSKASYVSEKLCVG